MSIEYYKSLERLRNLEMLEALENDVFNSNSNVDSEMAENQIFEKSPLSTHARNTRGKSIDISYKQSKISSMKVSGRLN